MNEVIRRIGQVLGKEQTRLSSGRQSGPLNQLAPEVADSVLQWFQAQLLQQRTITIGNSLAGDVVLVPAKRVDERHLQLTYDPLGIELIDLDSALGTKVTLYPESGDYVDLHPTIRDTTLGSLVLLMQDQTPIRFDLACLGLANRFERMEVGDRRWLTFSESTHEIELGPVIGGAKPRPVFFGSAAQPVLAFRKTVLPKTPNQSPDLADEAMLRIEFFYPSSLSLVFRLGCRGNRAHGTFAVTTANSLDIVPGNEEAMFPLRLNF